MTVPAASTNAQRATALFEDAWQRAMQSASAELTQLQARLVEAQRSGQVPDAEQIVYQDLKTPRKISWFDLSGDVSVPAYSMLLLAQVSALLESDDATLRFDDCYRHQINHVQYISQVLLLPSEQALMSIESMQERERLYDAYGIKLNRHPTQRLTSQSLDIEQVVQADRDLNMAASELKQNIYQWQSILVGSGNIPPRDPDNARAKLRQQYSDMRHAWVQVRNDLLQELLVKEQYDAAGIVCSLALAHERDSGMQLTTSKSAFRPSLDRLKQARLWIMSGGNWHLLPEQWTRSSTWIDRIEAAQFAMLDAPRMAGGVEQERRYWSVLASGGHRTSPRWAAAVDRENLQACINYMISVPERFRFQGDARLIETIATPDALRSFAMLAEQEGAKLLGYIAHVKRPSSKIQEAAVVDISCCIDSRPTVIRVHTALPPTASAMTHLHALVEGIKVEIDKDVHELTQTPGWRMQGVSGPSIEDLPMVLHASLLGNDYCPHPEGQWRVNLTRDAIVLRCNRCMYERIAWEPAHRIPDENSRRRLLGTGQQQADYLAKERAWRQRHDVAMPDVSSVDELTQAEGTADLSMEAHAIGEAPVDVSPGSMAAMLFDDPDIN